MNKILKLYSQWAEVITGEKVQLDWCSDWFCVPIYPFKIWVAMLISEENTKTLPHFLQENFNCKFSFNKISLISTCFIHECGHIMTAPFIDDNEDDYQEKVTPEEYRKLPKEWAADEWMVNYINNNAVNVFFWQKKIEQAYSKITQKDLENFLKSKKFL